MADGRTFVIGSRHLSQRGEKAGRWGWQCGFGLQFVKGGVLGLVHGTSLCSLYCNGCSIGRAWWRRAGMERFKRSANSEKIKKASYVEAF